MLALALVLLTVRPPTFLDLSADAARQVVVDRKPGYLVSRRFTLEELDHLAAAGRRIDPVASFSDWLSMDESARPPLTDQPWSTQPLNRDQAQAALLTQQSAYRRSIESTRLAEWTDKVITQGDLRMKFEIREFGTEPKDGRSLYISMHGGGSVDAPVNEQQWQNQVGLYTPDEGLYIAPRAPTDAWNMWHQPHIDSMFTRLIENAVVFGRVNPDRVYLMGYSAGGDGVYQLAPRMADSFAASSMMAGHPNEARPEGLRNLPFAIHMGAEDAAFNRNRIAREWGVKLDALRNADPDGYEHVVTLHEGLGHWMKLKDAVAVAWMATHTRQRNPSRVVWVQDDVTHARFYWLGMQESDRTPGATLAASIKDGAIFIDRAEGVKQVQLFLNDDLLDLSKPVRVTLPDGSSSVHPVTRTVAGIHQLHLAQPDISRSYVAQITVALP
jgi:hypothetical protein